MPGLAVMPAVLLAAFATLGSALPAAPAARADPGDPADPVVAASYPPPFVDHVEWVRRAGLSSLRVYPSRSGRAAALQTATAARQAAAVDEAWAEVLGLEPGAGTAGMRAQFVCHWRFAEFAQPGKTSWNLEPWRPVVDDAEMVASGCNPGGPEEAF